MRITCYQQCSSSIACEKYGFSSTICNTVLLFITLDILFIWALDNPVPSTSCRLHTISCNNKTSDLTLSVYVHVSYDSKNKQLFSSHTALNILLCKMGCIVFPPSRLYETSLLPFWTSTGMPVRLKLIMINTAFADAVIFQVFPNHATKLIHLDIVLSWKASELISPLPSMSLWLAQVQLYY